MGNELLTNAFPVAVRSSARNAISRLSGDSHAPIGTYSVTVNGELLVIPYRIYHDPNAILRVGLDATEQELLTCLLTRHCDGNVRQENLKRTIGSKSIWIPPFVVQLASEYVKEILDVIYENAELLDGRVYGSFLRENQDFFGKTCERIRSYWDCYCRDIRREDYVGFRLLRIFQSFLNDDASPPA